MTDRLPPHSQEHEHALLSCCIQEPLLCGREALDVFGDMCPFYLPECSLIWSAFQRVDLERLDPLTISDFLGARLDLTTIRAVTNEQMHTANFKVHLSFVRKHHAQRRLIKTLTPILSDLHDPKARPDDIVQEIRANVSETMSEGHESTTMAQSVAELRATINTQEIGTGTGYDRLDAVVAPIPWPSVIVIAARAKIGKSALSMGMCINLALKGHHPVYYSLEMPHKQLTTRAIASVACISSRIQDMRMESESEQFIRACDAMAQLPIEIEDGLFDWKKIKRDMRIKAAKGATHFFLDHLGLIRNELGKSANREREIASITADCKQMAMEFKRPIFIVCQLNRLAEGVMPKLNHLRESGAIEQDADAVILLHRERVDSNREAFMHIQSGGHVDVTAMVAANRHGPEGPVQMKFYPKFSLFSND